MLDPVEPCFAQLPDGLRKLRSHFKLIQARTREAFRQFPGRRRNGFHPRAAMILAEKPWQPVTLVSVLHAEHLATSAASIEARQPAGESNGPEGEVAKRQRPTNAPLHFPHRQQAEPEHGFVDFVLRKNHFRDPADSGEAGAQSIIALRLVERLQQFALLDTYEVACF